MHGLSQDFCFEVEGKFGKEGWWLQSKAYEQSRGHGLNGCHSEQGCVPGGRGYSQQRPERRKGQARLLDEFPSPHPPPAGLLMDVKLH